MVLDIVVIISSLAILFISSNIFIDGAVALASRLKMPTLLVGVIIIGFGTSTPEIIVSTFASMDGSPGIALGNAYGSNIINIAVILGLAALISPIMVQRQVLKVELPILLTTAALSFFFMQNNYLSHREAALLLSLFLLYMGYTLLQSYLASRKNPKSTHNVSSDLHWGWLRIILSILGGLIALVVSARGFVWSASSLARLLGVSDLVIGLTIVSLGTSLPELFSTIAASIKRQHDMAIGNIIGSNIFNTLVVVGIAGVIHPIKNIDSQIIWRDIPVMSLLSLLLFIFSLSRKREHRINRLEGLIFLLIYAVYLFILLKTR